MKKKTINRNRIKRDLRRKLFFSGFLIFLTFFSSIKLTVLLEQGSLDVNKVNEKILSEIPHMSENSAWASNGTAICKAEGVQQNIQLISDGAGGAVITWEDERDGNSDIYAQRISSAGAIQWIVNGTPICTATNDQGTPQLISDGAGGAIISWHDYRSGNWDIYAQKISSAGTVQWTADGIAICTAANSQRYPQLTSDGAEGAIITWWDYRSGNWDIYAQKISSAGTVQWTADGIAICTAANDQDAAQLASDGAGGAVITWRDGRVFGVTDIYAQRINSAGTIQWTANGIAICNDMFFQLGSQLVSDGAGGTVIVWQDLRSATDYDIYAQKINSAGAIQWTVNGTAICTFTDDQINPQLIDDGAGGIIITWQDGRNGPTDDIYAQKIDSTGAIQWTVNGTAICTFTSDQRYPQLASDGANGAIITWWDLRRLGNSDIYAQKIDTAGEIQWTANGTAISTATNSQSYPQLVSDGAEGSIIVWEDERSGIADIYAQKITDQLTNGSDDDDDSEPKEQPLTIIDFLLSPLGLLILGGTVGAVIALIMIARKKRG